MVPRMILERVTAMSYYDALRERLLDPTRPADRRHIPGLGAGYLSCWNRYLLPPKTVRAGILEYLETEVDPIVGAITLYAHEDDVSF